MEGGTTLENSITNETLDKSRRQSIQSESNLQQQQNNAGSLAKQAGLVNLKDRASVVINIRSSDY